MPANAPSPDPAARLAVVRTVQARDARPQLPALIRETTGGPVRLERGEDAAWLISPALADELALALADAPVHGIAEARPVLATLVQNAAAGQPQVLRRHKATVAVLTAVPATASPEPAAPVSAEPADDFAELVHGVVRDRAVMALTSPDPASAQAALTAHLDPAAVVRVSPEASKTRSALLNPLFAALHPGRPQARPRSLADTTALIAAALKRRWPLVVVLDAHRLPTEALEAAYTLWAADPFPLVLTGTTHLDGVLDRPALASLKSQLLRHTMDAPGTPQPPAGPPEPADDTGASAPAAEPHKLQQSPVVPAPAVPSTESATAAASAAEVAPTPAGRRRITPLGDALEALLTVATADEAERAVTAAGLPTGIAVLDSVLGGLQPGRFHLVAGEPGTGSSLIATAAARASALTLGHPVLYAASGLTRADVAARVIAAQTPVDYRRLRAGALDDAERGAVAETARLLSSAQLLIDDGSGLDAAAITETAADFPGLALVIVDRLQAARDPRLPLSGPPALRDAVQALTHLARTHGIPVLAALDTDDAALLRALAADVTLLLERHHTRGAGDQIRVTVAERDLGEQATVVLQADFAHARLTDPGPVPAAAPAPAQVPVVEHPAMPSAEAAAEPPSAPEQEPTGGSGPAAGEEPTADGGGSGFPTDLTSPDAWRPVPEISPGASGSRGRRASAGSSSNGGRYGGRDYDHFLRVIRLAVAEVKEQYGTGKEAIEAAKLRGIPDGMALFEATRVGATYEHTVYPERLEFLRKKTQGGADEVWEGRHNWTNRPFMSGLRADAPVTIDALDTNAAYMSALKTHLPIGALQHDPDGGFHPKRSGIYLLPKRPLWQHPHLPDPIGNRQEPGAVLLDDATVRLLIRCHKLDYYADLPHITESWTSGASENLLEKFRRVLNIARDEFIAAGDEVGEEYVKAMYSKFVSTIGESTFNRELRRPDWMHILRSQAFANLWYKAEAAHRSGLTIVRLKGTDELHVTGGEWRRLPGQTGGAFVEGRDATQMKLKRRYIVPENYEKAA